MRSIVLFEDEPEMMAHRAQYKQQHVDYVRLHQDEILVGGGLKQTEDSDFIGGLWITDVADKQRLINLVENDPYFHPQYRRYRVLKWGKVLEDREVTI